MKAGLLVSAVASVALSHAPAALATNPNSAEQQMEHAAIANTMAAFVGKVPDVLKRKLTDYPHTRFRDATVSVVRPLAYLGHGFILCGETKLSLQDAQNQWHAPDSQPNTGWQRFVVDQGLAHAVPADPAHLTLVGDGPEAAQFVEDACLRNKFRAQQWTFTREPNFLTKEINPDRAGADLRRLQSLPPAHQ